MHNNHIEGLADERSDACGSTEQAQADRRPMLVVQSPAGTVPGAVEINLNQAGGLYQPPGPGSGALQKP